MGKRTRGAVLRATKRAKVVSQELVETVATTVETSHVTSKADEQLFVLDTTAQHVPGGVPKKGYVDANQRRKQAMREKEEKKVQELLKTHDVQELRKMAKEAKTEVKRAIRVKNTLGNIQPKYDLWGTEIVQDTTKTVPSLISPGIGTSMAGTAPAHVTTKSRPAKKFTKKTLAVQVAHGGQSYHPDPEQHQDVIGEALALELRRKEVDDYMRTPISMSETTKALLLGSDDEEEDESDDEDGADMLGANAEAVLKRKKEKMTKAQRNKQKRHRALEKEIDDRKRTKKLLNSVVELKRFNKELTKKQQEDAERKMVLQTLKEESERTLGKNVLQNLSQRDPLRVPSLPVALSTELSSSLRAMKPKGSLVEDRFESFRDRSMTDKKFVGQRKKVVQGKKRVKGRSQYADGDYVLMG